MTAPAAYTHALQPMSCSRGSGRLSHSVSSIWWGRDHRLDEKQEILILKVGNGGFTQDDKATPRKTVQVRLKTGEVVKEEPGEPKLKESPSTRSGGR
jgi:hypothetical protein